jgi:hypothetical protein
MKRFWRARAQSATALLSIVLACQPVQAHNSAVHQDLTDMAYEIMRGIETGKIVPAKPANVAQADWDNFLAAIKAAPGKLRQLPTGLPNPKQAVCPEVFYGVSNNPGPGWSQGLMKDVPFPVAYDYTVSKTCGVRFRYTADGKFDGVWAPEGWYSSIISMPDPGDRGRGGKPDYTGNVLGLWAANVDNEFDDSHIWARPTSAGGTAIVKSFTDELFGILALTLPVLAPNTAVEARVTLVRQP